MLSSTATDVKDDIWSSLQWLSPQISMFNWLSDYNSPHLSTSAIWGETELSQLFKKSHIQYIYLSSKLADFSPQKFKSGNTFSFESLDLHYFFTVFMPRSAHSKRCECVLEWHRIHSVQLLPNAHQYFWEKEKQQEERTEAITSNFLLYPDKSL